jgi:Tol biopolymer transport system component
MAAGIALYIYQRLQGDPIPLGTTSDTLAYMSNEQGNWDVMIIDADGNIANLTDDGSNAADFYPSWAFSAERLNFLTNRAGDMGAGQVSPDGTNLKTLSVAEAVISTLADQLFDWDPEWSLGGEQLTWISLRPLNLEIFAGDPDAQNGVRLTNGGARDWFAVWSPDATQIAFASDREGEEDIYIMNPDGSNLRRITNHPETTDTRPAWSLDGETFLFTTERNLMLETGEIDFYLMDVNGDNQRPLGDEIFTGAPVYSPDGSQVAYMSNEEGDWNIYVMDSDGSNVRRLTASDADEMFPVWRPTPLADELSATDEG